MEHSETEIGEMVRNKSKATTLELMLAEEETDKGCLMTASRFLLRSRTLSSFGLNFVPVIS